MYSFTTIALLACLNFAVANPFTSPSSGFSSGAWSQSSAANPFTSPHLPSSGFSSGAWSKSSAVGTTPGGSSSTSRIEPWNAVSGIGARPAFDSVANSGPEVEYSPLIIEQVAPTPFFFGLPLTPAVLEHESAPYHINYFGTPYVIKHKQSAALNVHTQTPVVLDTYAEPKITEKADAPAVIVKEVCPSQAKEKTWIN